MTLFLKAKLKKSYNLMNIDKYRVVANITEYHIKSNSNFLRIIIPKFMIIRQFYIKVVCKNWTDGSTLNTCIEKFASIIKREDSSYLGG